MYIWSGAFYAEKTEHAPVAVHARMGDSCDQEISHIPTRVSSLDFSQQQQNIWAGGLRKCAAATVYKDLLRKLGPSKRVFVATDDDRLLPDFQESFPDTTFSSVPLNRTKYKSNRWVELRTDIVREEVNRDARFEVHGTVSATPRIMVASYCSRFSRLLYAVASFHQGRKIRAITADGCRPAGFGELTRTKNGPGI